MSNIKRMIVDCFCGQSIETAVAVNTEAQITCPACDFIWTVSRSREPRGVAQTVRPTRTGKNPIDFKTGDETLHVAPYTELK